MKYAGINNKIINEIIPQIRSINESKLQWKDSNEKFGGKLLGNVIASIIRNNIINIINYYGLDYNVSLNNSFIEGCPIEWDLIIFKKGLLPDNNVYKIEQVFAVIEFKTSGTIDIQYNKRTKLEFLNIAFDKQFKYLNTIKQKIPFGYITFSTDIDWFKATKDFFDDMNNMKDTCFAFLDDKELCKNKIIYIEGCSDFEKYIFNLLSCQRRIYL